MHLFLECVRRKRVGLIANQIIDAGCAVWMLMCRVRLRISRSCESSTLVTWISLRRSLAMVNKVFKNEQL